VLTDQSLLDMKLPHVCVCPLSGRFDPNCQALHLSLPARDSLKVRSYALVEHCRAISIRRQHRLVGW